MNLVSVYGFPRSGNHLVMSLLADNFYPGVDLTSGGGGVGHWNDRVEVPPVPNGKLAGHHGPPQWGVSQPAIYVFRDGRAVAASLWRSPHFKHTRWHAGSFTDFIHAPLDWAFSPGRYAEPGQNIIEHWAQHLQMWCGQGVLRVRYEELCANPTHWLEMFAYRFNLASPKEWRIPDKLVGHFPSGGARDGWQELWSEEDTAWFFQQVPHGFYGVWCDE